MNREVPCLANGSQLLEPVFHFLDGLIHDHGDILYWGWLTPPFPLRLDFERRFAAKAVAAGFFRDPSHYRHPAANETATIAAAHYWAGIQLTAKR